jgi:signal transduction histidine kinase
LAVSHELRTPLSVIRDNAEVGLDLGRESVHDEILEEIVCITQPGFEVWLSVLMSVVGTCCLG